MVCHNHIFRVCFGAALIILRASECVRDREEMNAFTRVTLQVLCKLGIDKHERCDTCHHTEIYGNCSQK